MAGFLAQCEPLPSPSLWGVGSFSGGSASLPWASRSSGRGWYGFPCVETLSDRMRSVHAVPNLAKSLIVVARKAFRPLQQARLCCKGSLHRSDLLGASERRADANPHATGGNPRLRRPSTPAVVASPPQRP